MDQLAQMFPQMDPSQMGAAAGFNMADQQIIARQNAGLNQQMALQDIFQQEQMNPLKVKHQQLTNEGLVASTKESDMRTRKGLFELDEAERLKEPKYQSMLAKLKGETSEAELKQTHARIEQEMLSPDPKVRNRALGMYKMTGDMIKMYEQERERRTTSYGVASISQQGQDRRADAKIADKNKALNAIDERLTATKGDPIKMYSILSSVLPNLEPGSAEAIKYGAQLEGVRAAAEASYNRNAVGKPVLGPDGKWTLTPPMSLPASPAAASRPQRQVQQQPPMFAKNPKTGERITSLDGGKTWQPAQ